MLAILEIKSLFSRKINKKLKIILNSEISFKNLNGIKFQRDNFFIIYKNQIFLLKKFLLLNRLLFKDTIIIFSGSHKSMRLNTDTIYVIRTVTWIHIFSTRTAKEKRSSIYSCDFSLRTRVEQFRVRSTFFPRQHLSTGLL